MADKQHGDTCIQSSAMPLQAAIGYGLDDPLVRAQIMGEPLPHYALQQGERDDFGECAPA